MPPEKEVCRKNPFSVDGEHRLIARAVGRCFVFLFVQARNPRAVAGAVTLGVT